MRKNTEKQAQDKLNRIQDIAMELFAKKGFDSVSVMDICVAAGITKPTFYKYIDTKERIILHYFSGALTELEDLWQSMADSQDHLGKVLLAISNSLRKVEYSHPDLFKKYISYCLKENRLTARYTSDMVPKIVEEIKKAQEAGQIRLMTDPNRIYIALRNIGMGVSFRWVTSNADFNLLDQFFTDAAAYLDVNPEYLENYSNLLEKIKS